MDVIDLFDQLDHENHQSIEPIRKYMTDFQNPLEFLSATSFQERYRLTKESFSDFLRIIWPSFNQQSIEWGCGVPVFTQFLVFLRYISSGSFQIVSGDLEHVSQATVSRIVSKMAKIVASKSDQFIKCHPMEKIQDVKKHFFDIAGFPGVVGAIDCTHVKIQSVGGENAEYFRNRKDFFSINCQAVCDAQLMFTNLVARWPGSVHDARIFDNSQIMAAFESGEQCGFLLGDQGYPCLPYLLTPFRNPATAAQLRYNTTHKKTRLVVERAFGVIKRIFSCLKTGLRTKLENTLSIIVSCFVLYNFMRSRKIIDIELDAASNDFFGTLLESDYAPPATTRGAAVRSHLTQLHF